MKGPQDDANVKHVERVVISKLTNDAITTSGCYASVSISKRTTNFCRLIFFSPFFFGLLLLWGETQQQQKTRPQPTPPDKPLAPSSQAHWQKGPQDFHLCTHTHTHIHTYIHTYRWVWTGNLFEIGRPHTIEPSAGGSLGWFWFGRRAAFFFLLRSPICWTISTLKIVILRRKGWLLALSRLFYNWKNFCFLPSPLHSPPPK